MPDRAARICQCGKVVPAGKRCACQIAADRVRGARADAKRPNSSQRGYNGAWEAKRKAFLARRENRVCKWPGCKSAASHVDHIIPHRGDPVLRDDPGNWQGLCAHHHNSAKQRLERRNFPRG